MKLILLIFCSGFLGVRTKAQVFVEESIIANDVANRKFVSLSANLELLETFQSPASPNISYRFDVDKYELLLGEKRYMGFLYYISNSTGQSTVTPLTFTGNGTIIDLALDAKFRMAYVATNLGLLYSVNIQLNAISLIKNISQQPVRALKLDRREGVLYLLQGPISSSNINKYFIGNGSYASGPILDKAIDNFSVDFKTKKLFGSFNSTIYNGSLNLGTLSQFYVGKHAIKEFVFGIGYLVVSVPLLKVIVKVNSTTRQELKNYSIIAENVAILFPDFNQQTAVTSAMISRTSAATWKMASATSTTSPKTSLTTSQATLNTQKDLLGFSSRISESSTVAVFLLTLFSVLHEVHQ